MVNKKFPTLFFFLIIALSLFVLLPSITEPVYATDYDVFEITNARSNLYNTYAWNNFLYLYNDTAIIQYNLATKIQIDTIALGASTIVYSSIGRGAFWYLNATVIGVPNVIVIDLTQFIEADRITKISLTNWNDDLRNLAYIYDSGIDYWAWGHITGDEINVSDNAIMTMNAYSIPTTQYPRFVAFANMYHGTYVAPVYAYAYIWNGTGAEYEVSDAITVSQHRGATYSWTWDLNPSIIDTQIHENNIASYRQHGYNIGAISDSESRFESLTFDSPYYGVYATADMTGIHSLDNRDFVDGSVHPITSDTYHYTYDTARNVIRIKEDDKTKLMFVTHLAGTQAGSGYQSTIYNPSVEVYIDFREDYDGDWDRDILEGVIAGLNSIDEDGYDAFYVAYVIDVIDTPVALKVYGAGNLFDEVGILPAPYDPDDCVLWSNMVGNSIDYQDDGIVAVWTENADNSLYVCVNLIEGQYMRYGETQNVIAQVYKSYATGTVDNFRLETRWMIDTANYPRVSSTPVYVYQDNVYWKTFSTNGYGILPLVFSFNPDSYPYTISQYMNKTGYNDQWLNVTYYSYSSQSADSTITEEPVITLEFTDNRDSQNMRVKVSVLRYTGEQFGDEWFIDLLNIHTYVETYAGDSLDGIRDIGIRNLDVNGEVEFILSYSEPYGYIVKHYYNTDEQNICIGNFTENSQIQFAYDSSTGNISEGEYVSLPDTPTGTEFYPTGEDAINPTTIEGFAVIWSANTGFLIAIGFIVAITVGFAKVSPESAIFGVITLVGLVVGFLGYTGLLPFPIFVVVLLVIVLAITVIFTNMLTGGKGKSE